MLELERGREAHNSSKPHRLKRIKSLAAVLSTFVLGHGAVQAINAAIALFLMRELSVDAYAQYSLANGFQATAITLTSLGLTDSIVPLVGHRADSPAIIGAYVRSASHLRNRLFLAVAPCCALVFHLIAKAHTWTNSIQLVLLGSILGSLYFSVSVSSYSAPLIIKGRLHSYYLGQTASGIGRLTAYFATSSVRFLNAGSAAIIGALGILLNGTIVKKQSSKLIDVPRNSDPAINKEVLGLVLPIMPAAIFSAFQSQNALFLISIFGQTTEIAQVAALSRLAQLFLVLNAFNSTVIEPYIARLSHANVLPAMLRMLAGAIVFWAAINLFCWKFPQAVVAVLGEKYRSLDGVVGWIVLASALGNIANMLWIFNRARKWVFWRTSAMEICCLVIFQAAFLAVFGVRTTRNAALFSLAASLAYLVTHIYILIYGFQREGDVMRHRGEASS